MSSAKTDLHQPFLQRANALVDNILFRPHGVIVDVWSLRDVQLKLANIPGKIIENDEVKVRYFGSDAIITLKPKGKKNYILQWMDKE